MIETRYDADDDYAAGSADSGVDVKCASLRRRTRTYDGARFENSIITDYPRPNAA